MRAAMGSARTHQKGDAKMRNVLILLGVAGCAALMNAAACGGDNGGSGGTGGMGGSGGTGTGGSAGSTTAGTGGTGGNAGSATAGTGGTGGSAGTTATGGTGGATTTAQVVACPATVAATLEVTEPSAGMYMYSPSTLTIHAGDVIEFHNTSNDTPHTFTSGTSPTPDGTWNTGNVAIGASACVQINVAGTYPFFCKLHPTSMIGTATVQ
jgi:plastocyanin